MFAKLIHGKSGWSGFVLAPMLLYPVDREGTASSVWPVFNPRALQSLTGVKGRALVESTIELAEEVGLTSEGPPDIETCLARLYSVRPDWPWRGDPSGPSTEPQPLELVKGDGIYVRAILLRTERPPFTVGLEQELSELRKLTDEDLKGTALGTWLGALGSGDASGDVGPLLEPMPLNDEQRRAVSEALSGSTTVTTGPPGTGKSQVVSSILVNAARQGTKVLFASKNNKAVDVVGDRTNALGSRPVMLRLGSGEHQSRIGEYLSGLLGARSTDSDLARLARAEATLAATRDRLESVRRDLSGTVGLRNETDEREQATEQLRAMFPVDFRELESLDAATLVQAAEKLTSSVRRADRAKQSLVTRLLWLLIRRARVRACNAALASLPATVATLGWIPTDGRFEESDLQGWEESVEQLRLRVDALLMVQAYLSSLRFLQRAASPELLAMTAAELQAQLISESETVWQLWLTVQPARLTASDRMLLGDYISLVKLLAGRPGRKTYARLIGQFNALFPRVVEVLPCWGITSLSVRGRVPFVAGFFDLAVIDEASQCDIASALPLLYRAKRVAVIGDPMQLRHVTPLSEQQDAQLLDRHELLEHAGWSYTERSLYDRASTVTEAESVISLLDHYRSHADIIGFSNDRFYEGRLRVVTKYTGLLEGDLPAVRWLDIAGSTDRPAGGSARNRAEADAVVRELERLVVGYGYDGSVGVVTPFRAQVNLLRDRIRANRDLDRALGTRDFVVDTADGFQGDERDIVLLSPVVTGSAHNGAVYFLSRDANRFNVAVTRARAALTVVGDRKYALSGSVALLRDLARYVDHLADRPSDTRPRDLGPEYPSLQGGPYVSEWERILYSALYRAGLHAIPQFPVEQYFLDMALPLEDRKLDIEVDGEHYHRAWDGDVSIRDKLRTQRLIDLGWDVLRFWVYEIRDDLDGCVDRVREWSDEGLSHR